MFSFKKETGAQLYDRFLNRTAVSLIMLAVIYALDASRSFAGDDMSVITKRTGGILGILIVLNLLPVTAKLAWFKVKRKPGCNDPDGFTATTFKEAAVRGFATGFIAMLVALELSKSFLADWSATTFLNIVLVLMLSVVSVSFLLANREIDPDDDFGDDFGNDLDEAGDAGTHP